MKIKQLFLGSAVALMALTACNKNGANSSVPTPEVGATAGVLRIEISSANGGFRAATVDGPNADPATAGIAGKTVEQGVTSVSTYVFTKDGAFVDSKEYTLGSGTFSAAVALDETNGSGKFFIDASAHKGEVLVLPFKTTAPVKSDNQLFVVINKPSFFPTAFANADEFTKAANTALQVEYLDGFNKLIADNNFMMVGMSPKFYLTPGITYDRAKDGFDTSVDKSKNQFAVTVNRVVSKLVVDYTKDDLFKEFGTGDAKAKLIGYGVNGSTGDALYYTVSNSNKNMFIYNNPNVNKDGDIAGLPNADYKTPNMDKKYTPDPLTLVAPYADVATLDKELKKSYNYYTGSFYRISENPTENVVGASSTSNFTPTAIKKDAAPDYGTETGKYFMEADNTTGNWLWANTPVAKIYACILPSKVYYLKDATTVASKDITSLDDLKGITEFNDKAKTVKTLTGDGSFLRGENNRYYASQAAANVDRKLAYNTAAGSGVKTNLYDKGRCLYRFPVNADNYDYTSFKNAYNKRNHIYTLTITGIEGIGDNYDPTDPTDPNVPKPVNPDEPTDRDPNKTINKTTVYAAVKATMANWTVVKNSVILRH